MNGKGVFDIGDEYQKALDLCLKKIMSERSPAATFDEIAKIKDSKKRLKLVREKMSESNELKVTRHKKKKSTSKKTAPVASNGGEERNKKKETEDEKWTREAKERGWVQTSARGQKEAEDRWAKEALKRGWEKTSSREKREAKKESWAEKARGNDWQHVKPPEQRAPSQTSGVNSVVIYTQMPAQELMRELAEKNKNTSVLIQSTRQKEGHVILMATHANDSQLRACVPGLQQAGWQSRIYHRKETPLAQAAEMGMQARMKESGVCFAYIKDGRCGYGSKCKFKHIQHQQRI
jgi:hypothetical protein